MVATVVRARVAASGHDLQLDAVRGLAALSVTTQHVLGVGGGSVPESIVRIESPIGEAGLGLFFVLSGFLLGGPFVRHLVDGRPRPRLRVYAVRRALRILPAYWVVFAVTALALGAMGILAETGRGGPLSGGDWLGGVFWVDNWLPGDRGHAVLPQSWSLSVEAGFYVVLPLVAAGLAAGRRERVRPERLLLGLAGAWAVLAVAEQLLARTTWMTGTAAGYVTTIHLTYLRLFIPGIAVAVMTTEAARRRLPSSTALLTTPTVRAFAPFVIGALLTVTTAIWLSAGSDVGLLEWRRDTAAAAAAVLVGSALASRRTAVMRAAVRLLAPVGTVAYGVYLLHWVVLRVAVEERLFPLPVPDLLATPAKLAVGLGGALILGLLLHVGVERPAMAMTRRLSRPRDATGRAVRATAT